MTWFIDPKRRVIRLIGCLFSAGLVVIGLSYLAPKLVHGTNGFIRLIPPHVAMPAKIRDLRFNGYYFAGSGSSVFYLCNYTAPALITRMSTNLSDSSVRTFGLSSPGGRVAKALKTTIDSPGIYLFEGITPTIAQGVLGDSLLQRISGKFFFNLAVPLSADSRVFRVVDENLHQNILVKQLGDSIIKDHPILEKQVDGIFCTDGVLHAELDSNRLVYVYTYRNQFICMDTNMQVRFRAKTVDTISRAKFTVKFVPSTRTFTLASPPLFVNKESCVSGNYLFVHSGMEADNDEPEIFSASSAIDVYSLVDGSYILTFYLPDYRHKKIREFRVVGNTIIALYDHYLYAYKLRIPEKLKK
jgi:hypothetical protein